MRQRHASTPPLCILFIALASCFPAIAQDETVLRVAVLTRDADPWTSAAERGVHFGIGEAAHTAALLGRRIELAREPSPANRTTIVVGAGAVSIRAGDDPACELRVDPSPERQQRAVRAWRARADVAVEDGELRAVAWHPELARFGASELNERFARATGGRMSAPEWLGWVAVKAIAEAFLRSSAPAALCDSLRAVRFDGHKGRPMAFDGASRELRQPLAIVRDGTLVGEADPWSGGAP